MIIKGMAWKFGDDINTDQIIAGRYLNTFDPKELARHCMEDVVPNFSNMVNKGDIIVAGKNFGCGSSREHAPLAIQACGISCIIAKSFARIFFRNSFNLGLPLVESEEAANEIKQQDEIEIDLNKGKIVNHTQKKTYCFRPIAPFMQTLLKSGGLMEYIKKKETHKDV